MLVLRRWYFIPHRGLHAGLYACVPIGVEREQPQQNMMCIPNPWVCLADSAFNICQNQALSALGGRYRALQVVNIEAL